MTTKTTKAAAETTQTDELPAGFVRVRVTKFGAGKIFTGEVIGLVNQFRPYGEIFTTNILRAQALEAKGYGEIQE